MGFLPRLLTSTRRDVALSDIARMLAERYGHRPAVDQDGIGVFTFSELSAEVDRLAGALHASGMRAGETVLIGRRNGAPLFIGILAASRAGAIPVPLNPQLTPHEIDGVADETGATSLLTDVETSSHGSRTGRVLVDSELIQGDPPPPPSPGMDDIAAIFTTSGTTGRSKGAELTHRGLVGGAAAGLRLNGLLRWTVLEALPVSHIMGFASMLSALAAGMRVRAVERFHPVRFLEDAVVARPEMIVAVPTMWRMVLDAHGGPAPEDALSSVRVFGCGSDVLPAAVANRLRKTGARGAVVVEGYGMVELSGAASVRVHLPVLGAMPRGDLGMPVPPWRLRVVNDRGWPVPPFVVGHLEVSGPGVLAGYRNQPGATSAAKRGRWLRTGDLARWSPFSGIEFAGRERDMVKVGGYSVYPREVEDELRACPGIGDVAAVGLPDDVMGEVIAVAAEPALGARLSAKDLRDFADRELAEYRRPTKVLVVDALPRNPNRKVMKHAVAALFAEGYDQA